MLTNTITSFIQNRRAIYPHMYGSEVIPDDQIIQLLEAANWAPSHKHTEPWRFVVYSGEGLKKFADFQAHLYKRHSTLDGTFDKSQHRKLLTKPLMCSHIIAIGAKNTGVVPHQEDICATSCAVQNLWLAASAMGLGCYWSTGGATYYEEAKPFFGLDQDDTLLGFINLGIFEKPWPQGKRGDLDEKITWVNE